jgi:pimeloyl-ACP methyl ester carboxylesterase
MAPGVVRTPVYSRGNWTQDLAQKVQAPTLAVYGEFDHGGNGTTTTGENTRNLFADLGTTHKVFLELACTSHFALWETRHAIMYQASLEWLSRGTVNGIQQGSLRLGE